MQFTIVLLFVNVVLLLPLDSQVLDAAQQIE